MSDYDGPWKDVLDHDLTLALAMMLPAFHADMDWMRDCESLEQELRKIVPASETDTRLTDKLIKAFQRGTGDPRILHVEVQGQPIHDLPDRMDVYNARARDRFGQPVASLVVLADDDPDWRPTRYDSEVYGTKHTLEFPVFKVLDWQGREEELEKHENLFALFLLAHLRSRQTRRNVEERTQAKTRLILLLGERKLDGEEMLRWYRYLDSMLDLPAEYETKVWQDVRTAVNAKEKKMKFVSYFERKMQEERDEQVKEKVKEQVAQVKEQLQETVKEQVEERVKEQVKEQLEERVKEQLEERVKEGVQSGLLRTIERIVTKQFGAEGLELMPAIRQVRDEEQLTAILDAILPPGSLADVRKRLAQP